MPATVVAIQSHAKLLLINLRINKNASNYIRCAETETRKRDTETSSDLESLEESDTESGSSGAKREQRKLAMQQLRRPSLLAASGRHHYGSFYLRMGAVGEYRSLHSTLCDSGVSLKFFIRFLCSIWHRQHDLFRPGIRSIL